MLGIDDAALIFIASIVMNLIVEVGAELVAEWIVHGSGAELPATFGHFGDTVDVGCIAPSDGAFYHLVGNAPVLDQCIMMLKLVVN